MRVSRLVYHGTRCAGQPVRSCRACERCPPSLAFRKTEYCMYVACRPSGTAECVAIHSLHWGILRAC